MHKLSRKFILFSSIVAFSLYSLAFISAAQAQSSDESELTAQSISQAELEQLLAPIALYPDTVLSHILIASTYPIEVVQAQRWLQKQDLDGQEAVNAAQDQDWDPSVKALLAFPPILDRMSQDLDWTQALGDAFLTDEESLLASVQNLRELAEDAGNLEKMEKVTVSRDRRSIIIEPREREIVYVPYYDTRVVYGTWPWRYHQPYYWGYPYGYSSYGYHAHDPHSLFYWGPRVSLSFGFFSNTFHWHNRHLVRISPYRYRPHRYYSHYDILKHRHAQRWRHNTHRRHAHRNRHLRDRHSRNQHTARANTRSYSERRHQNNEWRDTQVYDQARRDHARDRQRNTARQRPLPQVSNSRFVRPIPNRVNTNRNTAVTNRPNTQNLPQRSNVNRAATRTTNRQVNVPQPVQRIAPTKPRFTSPPRQANLNRPRPATVPKPVQAERRSQPGARAGQRSGDVPRRQPR